MIKMIATDLDGTFLRDDKTVSQYTLDVVEKVRQRGVIFAVATARPIRSVVERLPFIKFDVGIFHNGAVIHTPRGNIGGMGINEPDVLAQRILEAMPGANVSVESGDRLYCNYDSRKIWPVEPFEYTRDFAELAGKVADKLIVEAHTAEEFRLIAGLLPPELYALHAEDLIVMIMNRQATKLNGIRMAAEKYGIDISEVAAFGDNNNDTDMIRGCGVGVAVGNALDEVKQAADMICPANEADGVARWLEENILK